MTDTQTFILSASNVGALKSERRTTAKSGLDRVQTFHSFIYCLVALAIMPLCIPNLWEAFSSMPTFAIVGFSVGTLFILAGLTCAVVERARCGKEPRRSRVESLSR